MPTCVGMFGGVSIWRAIATECDAACLARAQMHPVAADLHALFAFTSLRLLYRRDRVEMRAASVGHYTASVFRAEWLRNTQGKKHLFIGKSFVRIPPRSVSRLL
jgi:hypothetical protein